MSGPSVQVRLDHRTGLWHVLRWLGDHWECASLHGTKARAALAGAELLQRLALTGSFDR